MKNKFNKWRRVLLLLVLLCILFPLLFLVGCQSKQARLLKETAWYEDSVIWYDSKYPGFKGLKINTPYIWMGKVVKVAYDSSTGEISDVYLENGECLKPYSMFSEDVRLWAKKKNFNSSVPKAGEYWAFRVNRNIKGGLGIIQAVRLKYDLHMNGVQVFAPLVP